MVKEVVPTNNIMTCCGHFRHCPVCCHRLSEAVLVYFEGKPDT